jgi:beta-barrel assembly-enhancing protease
MNFRIKSILAIILSLMTFAGVLFSQLKPVQSAERLNRFDTYLAQWQPKLPRSDDHSYKRAREILPGDYYMLYRIVDRLARANDLDQTSWRVRVDPTFDINAYATEANLLVIFNGLLDSLRDDFDAIASVMGHEIGHHTSKHIAVKQAELAAIQSQLETQKKERAEQLIGAKQTENLLQGILGGVLPRITNAPQVQIGVPILGIIFGQGQQTSPSDLQKEQEEEAKQLRTTLFHKQEYEADVSGYLYSARAGFKPEGSPRVLELLSRNSVSDSLTHPSPLKRIELIRTLQQEKPAAQLANEGKAKLAANTRPLNYDLSKDGKSLLIWRDRGDIDDRFPT